MGKGTCHRPNISDVPMTGLHNREASLCLWFLLIAKEEEEENNEKKKKKKVSVSCVTQTCGRIEFSSLRVTFSHGRNSLQNKLFLVPLLETILNCQERGSRGETRIDNQLYCQRQRTTFQNQRATQGMILSLRFCSFAALA